MIKIDINEKYPFNCLCDEPCDKMIEFTIDGYKEYMCRKKAIKFLYKALRKLEGQVTQRWKDEEKELIRNFINKYGMYQGYRQDIADILGRSVNSTKHMIKNVRMEMVDNEKL